MPVTLAQASLNATTDLDLCHQRVSLERPARLGDVRRLVNPAAGRPCPTATRPDHRPTAAFRAINAEYTPSEVTRQQFTVNLKPFGGSFQIDRVLAKIGPAATNDATLQMQEKIRASQATFANAVINGDTGVDANSFDGLSKMLTGTTTESTAT